MKIIGDHINQKVGARLLLIIIALGFLSMVVLGILIFRELFVVEARLNPEGAAYELNIDDQGKLWISDYKSGEIWGVNPVDGAFDIYPVGGSPMDARQKEGWLWWADSRSNLLGRISIRDHTYYQWHVPDAYGFLGTNLDDQGRLYATDSSNPYLYQLDPSQSELCTYTLPGYGASNYIVRDGSNLWLGDSIDSTILQLNINNDELTWWSLPPNSSPFGMAVDKQGNLWYADSGTKMIVRLNPSSSQLTGYLLPEGNHPQMVAIQAGMIWYTEQSTPSFGRLDPLVSTQESVKLTAQYQQLNPDCVDISPYSSGSISIKNGRMELHSRSYTKIINEAGWQIYRLPKNAEPWGIVLANFGYMVDSGRQLLIRFELTEH